MVGNGKGCRTPVKRKGSKDPECLEEVIDRFNRGIDDVDETIMDEDSLTHGHDKVSLKDSIIENHFTKPSDIEKDISWKEEETIPIHELVIRNPKDRGLKKRK